MNNQAYLSIVLAALLAGSSGVFVKYVTLPATSLSFIRTLLPSLLLGGLMLQQGISFFRGNYRLMLLASLLNALRMYLFFTAYIFTSIANAVIITFTWPIFVSIFSVLFLGERISLRNRLLLLLAFSGILITYSEQDLSFGNQDFVGMMAALGAAMMHAITVVIFKKESLNYSRTEIIFYQNLLGAFVFLPFLLINRPWPDLPNITIAASHAILLGIVAFNLFFYALRHLKASTVSLVAYLEIVSALLFSILWFHEPLTFSMMIGGSLILLASGLLKRSG